MKARVWKENGLWEWDVRDDREPRMRSTGCSATWRAAMDSVLSELAWLAGLRQFGQPPSRRRRAFFRGDLNPGTP